MFSCFEKISTILKAIWRISEVVNFCYKKEKKEIEKECHHIFSCEVSYHYSSEQ